MKKVFPAFILLLTFFSCLTEDSADPGKASTFLRYYNGGFDDQAFAFEETPDKGFIILATTQITNANTDLQRSKIKLIKVDQFGNTVWQTLYPAFTETDPVVTSFYYKGRGLLVEKNANGAVTGYTIVGDRIDATNDVTKRGVSTLFIMQTDAEGNFKHGNILDLPNVQGQSIVKDDNGYLMLGSRINNAEDMVITRFDADLNMDWMREYGEGGTSFVTGLMKDAQNNIFWGATRKTSEKTNMRLLKTVPESLLTEFGLEYGTPDYNEETGGICYSSFGPYFAFVGTTDELGSKDILYKKISVSGDVQLTKIIGDETLPEEGNAVCTTSDGGLLIIGTYGQDEAGDYYLIKLNHLGDISWSKIFGSKKGERGVGVKQISDGSYVVLGSTTLGGLNAIMLLKTDTQGNIE